MRRTAVAAGLLVPVVGLAGLVAARSDGGGGGGGAGGGPDPVSVRDGLERTVEDELALALYETPGSRRDLLAGVPRAEPDLWARIDADGHVSLDEFRPVKAVRDAVLTHAANVMRYYERRATGG